MITEEKKNGYTIKIRKGGPDRPERSREANLNPMGFIGIGGLGLHATPRNTGQTDFYRPRIWTGVGARELINPFDWLELLMFSRQLVAQRGNLGAAIVQKNLYAVGDAWKPHYMGDNDVWGEAAEEWLLNVWYPNCDVRGGVFDFVTNLFLSGMAYDVDGDDLCIFAIDEEGFPKLKFVPADCIGRGAYDQNKFVAGGPFDGGRMCNGIVVDRDWKAVAINVLGLERAEDELVSTYNCQLLYEPEWRSTCRGIPRAGKMCMDWFDAEDIDTFLKRGVKLDSSTGLLHWTESGEAPTATDIISGRNDVAVDPTVPATDIKSEYRMGGEILYLRANKGEKLEGLKSERPHPNTEAFIARLERRALLSIGWFYEMLNPGATGGAPTRMIQDLARHSVASRQKSLKRRALRAVQFAVSQGMEIGQIPKNYDGGDALKWSFNMPKPPTVDNGYDEQADRENLKIGSTTLAAICEKQSGWWKDFRAQRRKENTSLIDDAVALMKFAESKGQKLEFTQAMDLTSMMSANERRPTDQGQGQQQQQ